MIEIIQPNYEFLIVYSLFAGHEASKKVIAQSKQKSIKELQLLVTPTQWKALKIISIDKV